MSKTDLLTLLEREHRELDGQLKMLISTGEACQCVNVHAIRKLIQRMGVHVQVEEAFLYPHAKEEREVTNLISDFYAEHREIKNLLELLVVDRQVVTDVNVVMKACHQLMALLQEHVHKEEGQLFPVLRTHWDEDTLMQLGDQMLEMKDRALSGTY